MSESEPTPLSARQRLAVGLGLGGLLAVFAEGVYRWAFLCDDAYISFRYARNLVEGHGLVWNIGERVEGYTNFLWVFLTAAGMALGITPEVTTTTLGVLSGVAVLGLVTLTAARRWGWPHPLAWLPPALLVVNRSFVAWSTGGLATQLFTLLLLGGTLAWLSERERRASDPLLSSLLLAIATLVRPEGGLFTAVLGLYFLNDIRRGERSVGQLVRWCMPWFTIVGVHFLWRHSYYGEWWPNTFYAKVGGAQPMRGLEYIASFAWIHVYYAAAVLVFVGMAQRLTHTRVFAGLALTYLAYLCYVGGDHIAYRFMVPMLPFGALLASEGAAALARWKGPRLAGAVGVLAVLSTGVAARMPFSAEVLYYIKPIFTLDGYTNYRRAEGRLLRRLIKQGKLPEDLVLAAGGIGALGYESQLELVDFRGLADNTVTRQKMVAKVPWVGHELLATQDYLAYRGSDIIDVLNRLVHEPEQHMSRTKQAIKRVSSRWEGVPHDMPVICIATEEGAMVFATKAPKARIVELFGDFERCADAYAEVEEGADVEDELAAEPGG